MSGKTLEKLHINQKKLLIGGGVAAGVLAAASPTQGLGMVQLGELPTAYPDAVWV